jgi:hypothetical protein
VQVPLLSNEPVLQLQVGAEDLPAAQVAQLLIEVVHVWHLAEQDGQSGWPFSSVPSGQEQVGDVILL